jgi:hypothetical protein
MKFAVVRLACFLSRQQTLCRAIAVASRIVHGTLIRPDLLRCGVTLDGGLPGRMRSLIDGVCTNLLTWASP